MFQITIYIDEYLVSDPRVNRQKRFVRRFMGHDEDGKVRAAVGEFLTNFIREGGDKDGNIRNTETGHEYEDRG